MRTPEKAFGWVCWGIAIGVLFGASVFGGLQASTHEWCKPGEHDCFRQWVSALSGWVAGGVAFFTLFPIFRQLREMKRQTAFTVGDELPSIEIWTNNNFAVYRFRIINWNRRAFQVFAVRWIKAPVFEAETTLIVDQETSERHGVTERECPMDEHGRLQAWAVVEGWEDRTRAPDAKRFWQRATTDPTKLTFPRDADLRAQVEVVGVLAGETRKRIVLRAEAPTLVDLSPSRGGPQFYPATAKAQARQSRARKR